MLQGGFQQADAFHAGLNENTWYLAWNGANPCLHWNEDHGITQDSSIVPAQISADVVTEASEEAMATTHNGFDGVLCLGICHGQRNCPSRAGGKPCIFDNGIVHYLSRLEIQKSRPWLLQPLFTSWIELPDRGYFVQSRL